MEGFDDSVDVSNEEGGTIEEVEHAASPSKEDQQDPSQSYEVGGDDFKDNMQSTENDGQSPPPSVSNDNAAGYDLGADTQGIFSSSNDGPLLPEPSHMQEESSAFQEKEMRNEIIKEAEEYKKAFTEKRKVNCETSKTHNREREKESLFDYQVLEMEKEEHKGPKPGKPTDVSRMRQLISKLKQNPPPHMLPPVKDTKDAKNLKHGIDASSQQAKDGNLSASNRMYSES
ncbi:hypothetical protein AgCh_003713 [Apium graveolens]